MKKFIIFAGVLFISLTTETSFSGWSDPVVVDSTIDVPTASLEVRNDSIYIVYDHEFIRSVDGGQTWIDNINFPDGYIPYTKSLKLQGDTLSLFFGSDYPLDYMWFIYSEDFGHTWQEPRSTYHFAWGSHLSTCIKDSNIYNCAVTYYQDGGLLVFSLSRDFGQNWTNPESVYFYTTFAKPLIDEHFNNIYIASEYFHGLTQASIALHVGLNEGQTWVHFDSLTPISYYGYPSLDAAVDGRMALIYHDWDSQRTNDSRVYICTSPDSGLTWSEQVDISDSTINQFPRLDVAGDTIVACWFNNSGFIVKRSYDFAQSWESTDLLASRGSGGDVKVNNGNIYAAYHAPWNSGRALYFRYWQADPDDVDEVVMPDKPIMLKAYPNPFNSSTKLICSSGQQGAAIISIYNIQGQIVAALPIESQDSEKHEIVWDASALPSGIYFARLGMGAKAACIKLALIK